MERMFHLLRAGVQLNCFCFLSIMTPFVIRLPGITAQKELVAVMFTGSPFNQVNSKISVGDWVAPMYTFFWIKPVEQANELNQTQHINRWFTHKAFVVDPANKSRVTVVTKRHWNQLVTVWFMSKQIRTKLLYWGALDEKKTNNSSQPNT